MELHILFAIKGHYNLIVISSEILNLNTFDSLKIPSRQEPLNGIGVIKFHSCIITLTSTPQNTSTPTPSFYEPRNKVGTIIGAIHNALVESFMGLIFLESRDSLAASFFMGMGCRHPSLP